MAPARVLIVEDEPDILEVLDYNLQRAGFKTLLSQNGEKGLEIAKRELPALVLLDLMLPGRSGLSVCRELSRTRETKSIPVIIVSAKGEEADVVLGLEAGADDYVSKPFSPRILIARVRSVLKRSGQTHGESYATAGLVVAPEVYEARLDGEDLCLTATEFRILETLAKKPGRVFTRRQLLDHARGLSSEVADRNVDVHISSIRKKLGAKKSLIETLRGVGFRLKAL
jgi:DNA-binding response OmpR family regulator